MKRKLLLGIVVSAVFLYFALRGVDYGELSEAFASADYRYVAPAVLLSLASLWFRSVRWRYLLNPVKRARLRSLFSAASIGLMANGVLPVRLGEFVRAYVIGRKEGISKSSAFATIVVERIIDGITILAFFVVVVLRSPHGYPQWLYKIAYFVTGFNLLAVGIVVFLRLRADAAARYIDFLLRPFPRGPRAALTRLLHSFIEGLAIIRSVRNAAITALYSVIVWLPNAGIIYVVARSFGIELPVSGAFVVLMIVAFGIMIPSAPGFVGTIQYCSVAGLALFGVPKSTALSFSIVYHLCTFVPVVAVGFAFLFLEGYSLMELEKSAATNGAKADQASAQE
jgi:hypothetical protein